MLVIGIAGGIACGKSLVARRFQWLGAEVLDVDGMGHEVLRNPEVMEAIRKQWGTGVFTEAGRVDRQALAKIVFANLEEHEQDQLGILEQITHPRIAKLLQQRLATLRSDENVPAVVVDAPVMFKAGWDKFCDKVVFVDAPLSVRQERALESRNWSHRELASREKRQMSLTEKRERATDTIDNSGSLDKLVRQVDELWSQWGLQLPA